MTLTGPTLSHSGYRGALGCVLSETTHFLSVGSKEASSIVTLLFPLELAVEDRSAAVVLMESREDLRTVELGWFGLLDCSERGCGGCAGDSRAPSIERRRKSVLRAEGPLFVGLLKNCGAVQ